MKLIKALSAAAFSAALFTPSAFATIGDTETFEFSHNVAFTCSIDDGYQLVGMSADESTANRLQGQVKKIKLDSANGAVNLQFSPDVTIPATSDAVFKMAYDTGSFVAGTLVVPNVATGGGGKTLNVEFTDAVETGTYSAIVTATCVFNND